MQHKFVLKMVVALLLVGGVVLLSLASPPAAHESNSGGNSIALSAPPFIRVASAAAADVDNGSSFLDDEAGIAAYTQISRAIDLSVARDGFRTIERETDQYIIGSVGIPDYSEDHDAHVYIHTDGWVLAYYLNSEPASYILDLCHYDGVEIGTTKLEDAIYEVLSIIGVIAFETTYYDFRYPNATHIMLVAEANYEASDESFDLHLPSDFTYYDKSWSHAVFSGGNSNGSILYLNDISASNLYAPSNHTRSFAHGSFTTAQLPPGVSHNIRVTQSRSYSAFAGMALVYREMQ